jgi:hypothetical protein
MSLTIGSISSLLLPQHTIGPRPIGTISRLLVEYPVTPSPPSLIALAFRFDRLA